MDQFRYPIEDTRFETPSWAKAEHLEAIVPLAEIWGLGSTIVQEQMKKNGFWKGLLFSILGITGLQ